MAYMTYHLRPWWCVQYKARIAGVWTHSESLQCAETIKEAVAQTRESIGQGLESFLLMGINRIE